MVRKSASELIQELNSITHPVLQLCHNASDVLPPHSIMHPFSTLSHMRGEQLFRDIFHHLYLHWTFHSPSSNSRLFFRNCKYSIGSRFVELHFSLYQSANHCAVHAVVPVMLASREKDDINAEIRMLTLDGEEVCPHLFALWKNHHHLVIQQRVDNVNVSQLAIDHDGSYYEDVPGTEMMDLATMHTVPPSPTAPLITPLMTVLTKIITTLHTISSVMIQNGDAEMNASVWGIDDIIRDLEDGTLNIRQDPITCFLRPVFYQKVLDMMALTKQHQRASRRLTQLSPSDPKYETTIATLESLDNARTEHRSARDDELLFLGYQDVCKDALYITPHRPPTFVRIVDVTMFVFSVTLSPSPSGTWTLLHANFRHTEIDVTTQKHLNQILCQFEEAWNPQQANPVTREQISVVDETRTS